MINYIIETKIGELYFTGNWQFDGSNEELTRLRDCIISRYPGESGVHTHHIWQECYRDYKERCISVPIPTYLELFI